MNLRHILNGFCGITFIYFSLRFQVKNGRIGIICCFMSFKMETDPAPGVFFLTFYTLKILKKFKNKKKSKRSDRKE